MRQLAGRTGFFYFQAAGTAGTEYCTESGSQVAPIWQEERAHLPQTSKISNKQTTERDGRLIHTMRPEINSNDFGGSSIFVAAEFFF